MNENECLEFAAQTMIFGGRSSYVFFYEKLFSSHITSYYINPIDTESHFLVENIIRILE